MGELKGDVMGGLRSRCGRIEGRCDGGLRWRYDGRVEVEMWEN